MHGHIFCEYRFHWSQSVLQPRDTNGDRPPGALRAEAFMLKGPTQTGSGPCRTRMRSRVLRDKKAPIRSLRPLLRV